MKDSTRVHLATGWLIFTSGLGWLIWSLVKWAAILVLLLLLLGYLFGH